MLLCNFIHESIDEYYIRLEGMDAGGVARALGKWMKAVWEATGSQVIVKILREIEIRCALKMNKLTVVQSRVS